MNNEGYLFRIAVLEKRIEALEAALRHVETQLGLGHLHAALHILRAALAPETGK